MPAPGAGPGRAAGLFFPFPPRPLRRRALRPCARRAGPVAGTGDPGRRPLALARVSVRHLCVWLQLGCVENLVGMYTVSTRALYASCFVSVRFRSPLPSTPVLPCRRMPERSPQPFCRFLDCLFLFSLYFASHYPPTSSSHNIFSQAKCVNQSFTFVSGSDMVAHTIYNINKKVT